MQTNSFAPCAILLVLLASITLGCGAVSNPALEQAREAYRKASQDSAIVSRAGANLAKAEETLEAADQVWREEHDAPEVEHLAYLVEKRIEIARQIAQRRLAAEEIQQRSSGTSK